MATREQVEAAAVARLAAFNVSAYTTGQTNGDLTEFVPPEVYAELRVSSTSRGLVKGSATSAVSGWRVEVDVVGRLQVNVNRYLDDCQAAFYGHRFTIGSTTSTPLQEGVIDAAEPTGDKRFSAHGDWTFAL